MPWTTSNSNSDCDAFTKSSTSASKRRKTTNTSPRSSSRTSRSPAQQQQKLETNLPNMPTSNHDFKSPSPVDSKQIELVSTTSAVMSAVITDPCLSSPLAKLEEEDSNLTETDSSNALDERLTRSRRSNTSSSTTPITKNVLVSDIDFNEETTSSPRKKNTAKRAVSSSPSPLVTDRRPNLKNNNSSKSNHSQSHLQAGFMDECATPPYWNYMDGKPTRESSPPAKIKYPHLKMTFSDMNRRAKQIMDCISKMQVEEMKKPLMQDEFLSLQQRPRSLSTSSSSSSLSSASTIPFLDDYTTTSASSPSTPLPFVPKQEETSLEILERVNRELLKFQRKFGIAYQQPTMTTRASPSRAAVNGTLRSANIDSL